MTESGPAPVALPALNLVFPHTFVPWFRTVAPHIHAYHGKTFVVAIAGELIAAGKLASFAQDLAILQAMGIKIVLVHGFRPQVDEQLRSKGHAARHSHGMRITDAIATHPLVTVVREEIAAIPETSLDRSVIVATGPLTSDALSADIARLYLAT